MRHEVKQLGYPSGLTRWAESRSETPRHDKDLRDEEPKNPLQPSKQASREKTMAPSSPKRAGGNEQASPLADDRVVDNSHEEQKEYEGQSLCQLLMMSSTALDIQLGPGKQEAEELHGSTKTRLGKSDWLLLPTADRRSRCEGLSSTEHHSDPSRTLLEAMAKYPTGPSKSNHHHCGPARIHGSHHWRRHARRGETAQKQRNTGNPKAGDPASGRNRT
jgi:hypothetical protein